MFLFPLFLCVLSSVLVISHGNPQVEISDGKIQGKVLESKGGRKFNAFRGIPFAEPPIGPLRFKAPQPIKPWNNVLEDTQMNRICPQKQIFDLKISDESNEDCLYLNIYTPKLPSESNELLPVMVFFHCGGFTFGSGSYSSYRPEFLLDQDIVLVIGNYRLGALGFLSTGDEESPGNYGLKDQSLLLKWVNKNIKYFGGDPNSVTLFGESAGATSSHYHIFSPLSRGLFKAVISQSPVFNLWDHAPEGEKIKNAKMLAESVDCPTSPNKELVECLRKIDSRKLIDQDDKFADFPFQPVVEGPSPEAFLPDTPENLLKTGKFSDVPWLVGVNKEEGLFKSIAFLANSTLLDELNDDFNNKAALSILYKPEVKDIDYVAGEIRRFYFGDKKMITKDDFSALTNMYSDSWFIHGIAKAIRLYRKVSRNPIYNYIFSHNGPSSITSLIIPEKFYGTCHGDDLFYLFPNLFGLPSETEENRKLVELLTTLFTNFAKTSNPTPELNNIIKTKWKPVESGNLEYYSMDAKVQEMKNDFFGERMKFWDNLNLKVLVKSHGNPQVEINDGKIQGRVLESMGGRKFNAFRGIPFAEPPIGPLRFKAPQPIKPWKDVLDATQLSITCPQKHFDPKMSDKSKEDCLYLNVYTPKLPSESNELLPVMVFFHGGGFALGSGDYSTYNPGFLVDQDIVLVIGNYRLGALGFLSTGDEASPGNYGLKDQSLLLKWVNKNIEYFGGDPKSVTLFGESAGAASSHYHIFSPLSNGLFKAVISQSAAVFNPWAHAPEGENIKNAKILAESVNCPTSPNKELVECLRKIDTKAIIDQDVKFIEWNEDPMFPFKPVVEKPSPEAFLPDTPENLLKTGKFSDVPWLVGVNKEEGLFKSIAFLSNSTLLDELNDDFNNKAALAILYKPRVRDVDDFGAKLKKFYFSDKEIITKDDLSALTNMYSDSWFIHGVAKAIRLYRKVSKNPIYNYLFSHNGPSSLTSIYIPGKFYGTCHADDLFYLFPNLFGLPSVSNEENRKLVKLLTTLWTNFAKTSNPTPETNDIIKTKWEPVKSDNLEYYYMDAEVQEMKDDFFEERVKFWDNLDLKGEKIRKEEL